MPSVFNLHPAFQIVEFRDPAPHGHTSHLIVTGKTSTLINCHDITLPAQIARLNLPQPSLLLATHIDSPLNLQGIAYPHTPCRIPAPLLPLALDPAATLLSIKTSTWDMTQDWSKTMGREPWGVAGSRKYDPPAHPIPAATPISPGQSIHLDPQTPQIQLQAFSLPFHGPHSLGYKLTHQGQTLALFAGAALQSPGKLVQVFTFESTYGFIRFKEISQMLGQLAAQNCDLTFCSQGPALPNTQSAIQSLQSAIHEFLAASTWRPPWFQTHRQEDGPEISGYHLRAPGVYQAKKHANTILLIHNGCGLIIDPGPCDFENPHRLQSFHKNLDHLHSHTPLRTIDTILLTHFHGDHLDLTPEIKSRYPAARACAWAPVAHVIQNPQLYPYACQLPWYGLPHITTPIDHAITTEQPLIWHGHPITPVYTPGHAKAHAAYIIDFAGHRIAITGDSIQTNGELAGIQCIPCNDSVLGGDSSIDISYKNLLNRGITLNLGGHGSWFTNCDYHYRAALERIQGAIPKLRVLLPENGLEQAFRPRWFPPLDTSISC
jgi:glyoxylase-like metal-dependent hydrolase (beta-lactamase superfamily II)